MPEDSHETPAADGPPIGQPPASSIEDVVSFRLQHLVDIGERAGQGWSERLFGISPNEWRLLAMIAARQPSRAGDIADYLLMDKSQLSRVIKRLRGRKLIANMPDPDDGRAVVLRLTPKGRALHGAMIGEVLRRDARFLAPLSPAEVETLDVILDKLTAHALAALEAGTARPQD